MAQCERCGRVPMFGQRRPFSLKASKRKFRINVQRVTVHDKGTARRMVLCSRCVRTMAKTGR